MKRNSKLLRTLSVLAVIALVCLGLALHTGTGTPSAWGIYDIAAICPLGAAEAALASKTVVPPMLIALAIGIALVVLFGRAFCAWGCPIPLLRRIFGLKEPKRKRRASDALDVPAAQRGGAADSRNWVLGGAILSTAAFGFPVFCLVCPVGLTFGTLVVVWRVFQFNEVTWSLLVFPAMLVLELAVLRKWCHRFCPLGALLSLVSRGNRTFRPQANVGMCLHAAHGERCHRCADACPEGIDLHDRAASAPLNECVKCRECADACPVHAITFPFLSKKTLLEPSAAERDTKEEQGASKRCSRLHRDARRC